METPNKTISTNNRKIKNKLKILSLSFEFISTKNNTIRKICYGIYFVILFPSLSLCFCINGPGVVSFDS